jgi:hypothetical protein
LVNVMPLIAATQLLSVPWFRGCKLDVRREYSGEHFQLAIPSFAHAECVALWKTARDAQRGSPPVFSETVIKSAEDSLETTFDVDRVWMALRCSSGLIHDDHHLGVSNRAVCVLHIGRLRSL